MATVAFTEDREYGSGEIVEPGYYVDLETGTVVQVQERDELPDGSRTVRYQRRFRRVSPELLKNAPRRNNRTR